MNEEILRSENITKTFSQPADMKVLKGISISINKGEFVSIMGPSGSGKSTLLYILATLDTQYEGGLVIAGEQLKGKSQNELSDFRNANLGFVFQFHYLLPEFTVLQNVMIPALKLGRESESAIRTEALRLLDLLGVQSEAEKPANKLSGGQQQRVAIARALINRPAIIMCDEPTGNLDTKNSMIVVDILRDLARTKQQSIIAVTHDLEFARNTDRSIMLRDGLVVHE